MTGIGYMADLGARLIDNGWPIIPIMPGKKVPGRYSQRDGWFFYKNWQQHCARPTRPIEVTIWNSWPGCAVGIACGDQVVGIDIDIMDSDLAIRVQEIAKEMLGEDALLRIGLAPKRMLVYRAEKAFDSFNIGDVQIIANGRQFLGFAIHPDTQRPYQWIGESPADVSLEDLPVVSEAMCRAFAERIRPLFPDLAPPIEFKSEGSGLGKRGTYDALASALAVLPNNDLHYDEWIRIGIAIKRALGEKGRELFLQWSERSEKNDPEYSARKWDREMNRLGARGGREIGAGTVYALAEAHGWTCPAGIIMDGDMAEFMENDPLAPWLARLAAGEIPVTPAGPNDIDPDWSEYDPVQPAQPAQAIAPQTVQPVPAEQEKFMHPGGILEALTIEILATARSPQPFLSLAAAISAVSVLAGRKYALGDLHTNAYLVGTAESGGGKDHPAECIRQAFHDANLPEYLGGENIASGSGLLASLRQHPSRLFIMDEMGKKLSEWSGSRAAAHKAEIRRELLTLYSRTKGVYSGTEYANQRENARQDIHMPCASLLGMTTPSTFWQALESGALQDGLLARMLLFQSADNYPDHNYDRRIWRTPDYIVDGLRDVAVGAAGHNFGGDLCNPMAQSPDRPLTPYQVPMCEYAHVLNRRQSEAILQLMRENTDGNRSPVLARIGENANKLALIRAISRNPRGPKVEEADVEWGWALAEYCSQMLLSQSDRHMADNETQAQHKKVLEIIRNAGSGGISKTGLTRACNGRLKARDRDDIIRNLIEAGQVAQMSETATTKPVTMYLYIG